MHYLINLLICLFLLASPASIAASLALEIDADSSDCGTDLNNCTLNGNVVVRQGDARITADKLFSRSENEWELDGNITIEKTGMQIEAQTATILLAQRQLRSFALVGAPVNFQYLIDEEGRARGRANEIEFDLVTRKIVLSGDAQILEQGNELNGELIEYDIDAERLKANNEGKGDGRVRLIFEPPGENRDPQAEDVQDQAQEQQPQSDQQP
ncbi:MAG: lipopolysaccharide transport periplasmic protein LptA [Gammaproteobacteria bacterium]|nr:lipopolysaccharide transport periplasmic protein LptA [Gammaproteobacteria bacterium]NNC97304.1 lipopolysaccharide transport periplasmic protein LptA [Gammaproteobacteria bacterium]NNM14672.1 lipopolysaccharide transport periplasmic protein LptA [Gammaproteobacteria bacterium]